MAVPLTADICAHAVIAAARTYGDCPIKALQARRGRGRRSLAAAATALVARTGRRSAAVCRVLGMNLNTYALAARENRLEYRKAIDAAIAAVAGHLDRPARIAPAVVIPQDAPDRRTRPAPPRIDHTAAIAEAMARRKARGDISIEVVGVENDKALIGATEPGGCVWPMGDPREPGYRSCQTPTLTGRMYCAEHLKAAGMKVAPKTVSAVGRVARPFGARELEAEG